MNNVALITGANKGIGLETARQLGSKGIITLLGCRDIEKGNNAAAELIKEGINAIPVQLDVTKEDQISSLVNYITEEFGKLDILINNAGMIQGESFSANSTLTISQKDLLETFQTNFFGVVSLTQKLIPMLQNSDAGRIVNLSSVLASLTLHADSQSPIYQSLSFAYNTSKTALNQFTVHLAATLKDTNIKVNSAHPGWVKTDLGGAQAPMSLRVGAKTSVDLAMLDDDGPTGKYIHLGKELPW